MVTASGAGFCGEPHWNGLWPNHRVFRLSFRGSFDRSGFGPFLFEGLRPATGTPTSACRCSPPSRPVRADSMMICQQKRSKASPEPMGFRGCLEQLGVRTARSGWITRTSLSAADSLRRGAGRASPTTMNTFPEVGGQPIQPVVSFIGLCRSRRSRYTPAPVWRCRCRHSRRRSSGGLME